MAMFLLVLAGLLLSGGVSGGGNDGAIKTACTGTPYPEYCESQLSDYSKSAPYYASVPAVLAVQVAAHVFVKGSQDASSLVNMDTELPAAEEDCVVDCQGAIRVAVGLLQNASDKYPERTAVLADTRAYLAAKDKLRARWNCGRCLDKTKKTPPPNDLDKITDVVSSLVDRDADNANVNKACADTPYPDMCVSILSVFQGSKDADARVLAGLAVHAAPVFLNRAVTGALTRQNDESVTNATVSCFKECQAKMAGALDVLQAASPDEEAPGNSNRLADVRSFLDKAKADHVAWHCDVCRPDKKVQDEVSEGNALDKLMAILTVLLNRAASTGPAPK